MEPSGFEDVTRPQAVRVWLLGSFRLSVGSRSLGEDAWRLKKAANLVKLLALAPGHRLHREQAMNLLWPDSGRKAASNSLRRTLHDARMTLDPAQAPRNLVSEGESLVLCPGGPLWVDVEAFEEAAATAHRARDTAAYRAAIDLYTGELLPEDRYEEWAEERREELRQLYLTLLVELAGLYEERAQYERGLEALRRAVGEEPTLEEAHVGLMRLYALLGREGEASAQYERLRGILSREFGTQPSTATRRLHEEIVAGRNLSAQPLTSAPEEPPDASKHNLPASRTSFVGRQREMLEIKRELAVTRLLTLTGAGGSGKTRLALEVARDLIGAYPDGVWLVELAPLSEGALVPQAVAEVLKVKEQPGQSLTDTLIDSLHRKTTLLVLDSCEHLIDAAARLVDTLLDACPNLRVLATSREALRVSGEVNRPVPPLSVPDLHPSLSVAELDGSESARLFSERARLSNPAFVTVPENAWAVAEICQRLEGIPLAIELAAASTVALSVEQISERLEDSLKLLTGGSRAATPRQRTLRGALDWSHDLLSEAEKKLLRRLSAFAGGWDLKAAETVGAGSDVEEEDVLELLSKLVDKSLVVVEASGEGGVRFRMLEPVRQYARGKLKEGGEIEAVLRRHAIFFLSLAEEAKPELLGLQQAKWLHRLEREHDNLRATLSWALERKEGEFALRMGGALWRFWARRGHWSEGRKWLEATLAMASKVAGSVRAKALRGLGRLIEDQGDFRLAKRIYEESLTLCQQVGYNKGIAWALCDLGFIMMNLGDRQRATELLKESLLRFRELADKPGIANALIELGHIATDDGDYEQAQALYEESLALYREIGDVGGYIAQCLSSLGRVAMRQGDLLRAEKLLEESLMLEREVGLILDPAHLITLGLTVLSQGDSERATELIREGLRLACEQEDRLNITLGIEAIAMVAVTRGRAERMAVLWGTATTLREIAGNPLTPDVRLVYEPYLDAARAKLGEAAWETAVAEGQAMTLEEAVDYALSEEEAATVVSPTPKQLPPSAQAASLTRRQQEIAALVARGLTNRQIASELSISEHTVATHIRRILKKLGLHSRSQLTAWVIERRLSLSDWG